MSLNTETRTELHLTVMGLVFIAMVVGVFALGFSSGERTTEHRIAGAISTGAK